MTRRAVLCLLAYGLLLGSLATPLYQPFETGRDDSWAVLFVIAGAHLLVGAGIRRLWVLLLPVGYCVIAFVASGAEGLSALILVFLLPALLLVTALGWGAGVLARERVGLLVIAFAAIAVWPAVWASTETEERSRAPHAPASLQAQLPIEYSLGNLCPHAETPPALARKIRHQGEVLLREVRRHPDWLVSYTYVYADEAETVTKDITIRELAEQELGDLASGGGEDCLPSYRRRLEAGLG
jgi:hypothetical protein